MCVWVGGGWNTGISNYAGLRVCTHYKSVVLATSMLKIPPNEVIACQFTSTQSFVHAMSNSQNVFVSIQQPPDFIPTDFPKEVIKLLQISFPVCVKQTGL